MKPVFREAIDDPENPVIDVNAAGSDVLSILLRTDDGTRFVSGSVENVMLYIHEMNDFLSGDRGALLSRDPHLSVQKTNGQSVYRITYKGRPVESMPSQAGDVLEALRSAKEDNDAQPLLDLYGEIIDTQVRRDTVNPLLDLLPNLDEDRIEITESGWVIDKFYLVDWQAGLYVESDDGETFTRGGGGVTTVDKSKEFVELTPNGKPERKKVRIDGEEVIIGEREMMFLSKVQWVLKRTKYHTDEPFWRYNEQYRKKYLRGDEGQ